MNNIEKNALRIAELIGNNNADGCNAYERVIEYCGYTEWILNENKAIIKTFSSYNGLMPLVFECNNNTNMEIHIYPPTVQLLGDRKYVFGYKNDLDKTETEFIQAIQECVIKYLEQKNE